MFRINLRMALNSLKQAKLHSFLTMFGIIIGVSSVVTMVSLGEGFKSQIRQQVAQTGLDTITIRPGRLVSRDESGRVKGLNFFGAVGGGSVFGEHEVDVIRSVPDIAEIVPLSAVTGIPSIDDAEYVDGVVLGTTPNALNILNQKVQYGYFFEDEDSERSIAIIGRTVADELFKEEAPIGKTITIRGENFVVSGILELTPTLSLTAGTSFNNAVFIPYPVAKRISGGTLPVYEVLVRPNSSDGVDQVSEAIHTKLKIDHKGEEDFTVLKSQENVAIADNILGLATALIAGIAAISLVVGGIGIMNIMFALVTERTKEIGIRKAIGASNQQILGQFLIEAVVLSMTGGVIGIVISLLANGLFRILTDLQPVFNVPIMLLATAISIGVGVLSGVIPALRAARKDPIEALRYGL